MKKPLTARMRTNEDISISTSVASSDTPRHYVTIEDHEKLEEYSDYQEQQIKELKDDIEKIRHITYATFGEGWTYEKATIEEKKIADIDKIIYPKYYNSENENLL